VVVVGVGLQLLDVAVRAHASKSSTELNIDLLFAGAATDSQMDSLRRREDRTGDDRPHPHRSTRSARRLRAAERLGGQQPWPADPAGRTSA
jgi:hypothetical protein